MGKTQQKTKTTSVVSCVNESFSTLNNIGGCLKILHPPNFDVWSSFPHFFKTKLIGYKTMFRDIHIVTQHRCYFFSTRRCTESNSPWCACGNPAQIQGWFQCTKGRTKRWSIQVSWMILLMSELWSTWMDDCNSLLYYVILFIAFTTGLKMAVVQNPGALTKSWYTA